MTTTLPDRWWDKYSVKDAPTFWTNPHLMHIWELAPPEKQDITLMTIGVLKEQSTKRKIAMYEYTNREFEKYGVYVKLDPRKLNLGMFGHNEETQIFIAAMMEVFTPTGLYSKE